MVRKWALLLIAGLLIWQVPAYAQVAPSGEKPGEKKPDEKKTDETAKKWTGYWQTKGPSNYTEYWEITEKDGMWGVKGGLVNKENMFVGRFLGAEVTFKDGVLKFNREWFQKPNGNWDDSVKFTCMLVGDNLQYTEMGPTANATRIMTKMASAPVVGPQMTDLIGMWKGHHDGMDEVMTIAPVGNNLVVQVKWYYFNQLVGQTAPAPGQFDSNTGKMVFQQILAPPPKKNWQNAIVTLTPPKGTSNKMHYHWQQASGWQSTRDFYLVPGTGFAKAIKPPLDPVNPMPPNPNPNPLVDAQALIGSFSGDIDGFKEIWTITRDDAGVWAVKGAYVKGDEEVGGFTGRNVMIKDGKLTFTQEFTKIPTGAPWINGSTITITPAANNSLSYAWQVGAATGTRSLMKGR